MTIHRPMTRQVAKAAVQSSAADRIFIGACTAAYMVLTGAVLAALKIYGG